MLCLARLLSICLTIIRIGCEEDSPDFSCYAECETMNRGYYCNSQIKLYKTPYKNSFDVKGYIQHVYYDWSMVALDSSCNLGALVNSTNESIIIQDNIQTYTAWGESFLEGSVNSTLLLPSSKSKYCKIYRYLKAESSKMQEIACATLISSCPGLAASLFLLFAILNLS